MNTTNDPSEATDARADSPVRVERHGNITHVVLNRPDRLNALDLATYESVADSVTAAARDQRTRVLVLRGAGRAFAAGADIADYPHMSLRDFKSFMRRTRRTYEEIEQAPFPVIAAVHGYALGGGFELALACDLLVMADTANVGLPECRLALLPGGGGTQRLTRRVGASLALDLLLTGRHVSAQEALKLGLTHRVCAEDSMLDVVTDLAGTLARNGPLALAMGKRLVREGADMSQPAALSYEQDAVAELFVSRDGREGVQAFLDKRRPDFEGR